MLAFAALGEVALGQYVGTSNAAYSLAVDAGSFTLSGQTVQLQATRTIVAAAGAFTLAGQTVGLRSARTLAAAVGSFTLTGQSASLLSTRYLYCSPLPAADDGYFGFAALGSVELGGTGRQQATTFVLTGQGATLAVTMPAAVGVFTLAGQSVTLTVRRGIVAAVGSFALTGQPAGLLVARRLACAVGAFSLGGNVIEIVRHPIHIRAFSRGRSTGARSLGRSLAARSHGG